MDFQFEDNVKGFNRNTAERFVGALLGTFSFMNDLNWGSFGGCVPSGVKLLRNLSHCVKANARPDE